jgi:hypothetical protein
LLCEIVRGDINRRGRAMLSALEEAAGSQIAVTDRYTGCAPWVMMYGLGHKDRAVWATQHKGHVIGWDLGYWDRDHSMRLTINADHCWRLIHDRPARKTFKLRNDYDPDGHILLIGMGEKSRAQFGYSGAEWETGKLAELDAAKVIYKPKKPERFPCEQFSGPIEAALKGCSLVVCRHSNVAIDACIAGIPVICEDGAGYALYKDSPNPSTEQRQRFLGNLSWWNWTPSEALEAWAFIREIIEGYIDPGPHWTSSGSREPGVRNQYRPQGSVR